MEKYRYKADENEKLTKVRVNKVWLNEDLMPDDSEFKKMFPGVWQAIQDEVDVEYRGFLMELENLKQVILSNPEQFIVFLTTESKSTTSCMKRIGQRAYLTNRNTFIDITWLMGFTKLDGCRFRLIQPPYEDFVNELSEKFISN